MPQPPPESDIQIGVGPESQPAPIATTASPVHAADRIVEGYHSEQRRHVEGIRTSHRLRRLWRTRSMRRTSIDRAAGFLARRGVARAPSARVQTLTARACGPVNVGLLTGRNTICQRAAPTEPQGPTVHHPFHAITVDKVAALTLIDVRGGIAPK